jgi:hypothetical protein
MAFYNIDRHEPTTNSRQLIQISECDALGVALAASGTNVIFEFGSIRFTPTATGGYFNFTDLMGNLSKPFTKDDVIKYEGTAHGQASTYALFSAIATDIVA